jgi:hypothetical protein
MNRIATCTALAAVLLAAAACSGLPAAGVSPVAPPPVRVTAYAGSDWQAEDLRVDVAPAGQGAVVTVSSAAAAPAHSVLLDLVFDPQWQASVVSRSAAFDTPQALGLIATARPGVAGIGLVLPGGGTVGAGVLATLRLAPVDRARAASAAPQSRFGAVTDLAASLNGADVDFTWSYVNAGDCDQNSEVNVADLSALAPRLHQSTTDGDQDDTDVVLDADGNGEINLADLSTIGQNYHGSVGSYNLYRADGGNVDTLTKVATVDFPLGSPNPRTRRSFSTTVDAATVGTGTLTFVVKADSAAGGSGDEGALSNLAALDLNPPQQSKFQVPPSGQQEPDGAAALSPSLVVMPAIAGVADAGAPVVVYLDNSGTLSLAYYNSGAWVKADISAGVAYTNPQAVWTGDGGVVFAFDPAAGILMALPFDNTWTSSGPPGRAYTPGVADVITALDADYDAGSGRLGVVSAYTTTNGQHIVYSEKTGATWASTDVYAGSGAPAEVLGGVSFRFDPGGGDPWCVYTVGTTNIDLANTQFQIATTLNLARFDGAQWASAAVAYPDSPLRVDLGFDAGGTAQLAMNAARNYHLSIPGQGSYDLTVLLDGTVGAYDGTTFTFPANPVFKSSATVGLVGGFPPTGLSFTLQLATDARLAGPSGACFAENNGELDFDLTFQPTGGSLAPATQFYSESGGAWSPSAVYTGSAGREYNWGGSGGALATAYLQGVSLDSTNLGQITSGIASNLEYWSQ